MMTDLYTPEEAQRKGSPLELSPEEPPFWLHRMLLIALYAERARIGVPILDLLVA